MCRIEFSLWLSRCDEIISDNREIRILRIQAKISQSAQGAILFELFAELISDESSRPLNFAYAAAFLSRRARFQIQCPYISNVRNYLTPSKILDEIFFKLFKHYF